MGGGPQPNHLGAQLDELSYRYSVRWCRATRMGMAGREVGGGGTKPCGLNGAAQMRAPRGFGLWGRLKPAVANNAWSFNILPCKWGCANCLDERSRQFRCVDH